MNFVVELKERNLIHQSTEGIREHMDTKATAYVGFDSTAPSLHIGNLATLMLLLRLAKSGGNFKAIALVGDATAMIGDPSGKSSERNILDQEVVKHNTKMIMSQINSIFIQASVSTNNYDIVLNSDWTGQITLIDFLRDIGKHAPMSAMLSKDSVKNRLETGLSFAEFTYQLIQGNDFRHLATSESNCTIQMGGQDQWGNMVAGMELVRRTSSKEVHVLTTPLITKADGTKFGKSEGGNIWLSKEFTCPFDFHQFWINVPDEEVKRLLFTFTFLSVSDIEALMVEHEVDKSKRLTQRTLADEVTKIVHGGLILGQVKRVSEILLNSDFKTLDSWDFQALSTSFEKIEVSIEESPSFIDMLVKSKLVGSKSEARKLIKNNGVKVNGIKITDTTAIEDVPALNNQVYVLQVGKNKFQPINIIY
jgi:tyrosyl-tRNA synthetase